MSIDGVCDLYEYGQLKKCLCLEWLGSNMVRRDEGENL